MIITFRLPSGFDRPFYITCTEVFIRIICDDLYVPDEFPFLRLYDDDGHLVGRAATYRGV